MFERRTTDIPYRPVGSTSLQAHATLAMFEDESNSPTFVNLYTTLDSSLTLLPNRIFWQARFRPHVSPHLHAFAGGWIAQEKSYDGSEKMEDRL